MPNNFLGFDWYVWLVLIKSEILITRGMGCWAVSSDKVECTLRFCLFVKIQPRSLIVIQGLVNIFAQYSDQSETKHDLARISLGGHPVWPLSKNYFEPCRKTFSGKRVMAFHDMHQQINPITFHPLSIL